MATICPPILQGMTKSNGKVENGMLSPTQNGERGRKLEGRMENHSPLKGDIQKKKERAYGQSKPFLFKRGGTGKRALRKITKGKNLLGICSPSR